MTRVNIPWGIMLAVIAGSFALSAYDFVIFHFTVELISTCIAFSAFAVAQFSRRFINWNGLWFIGVGLLCVAILNGAHTLTYKGMGIYGQDPNLPTQFWIAQRVVEAAVMLIGVLLFERRLRSPLVHLSAPLLSLGLVAAILTGWFPDCYVAPQGLTPFKIATEHGITAVFGLIALLIFLRRRHFDDQMAGNLIAAVLLQMVAEVAFLSYTSVYDHVNALGHLLRLAGHWFVFRALVQRGLEHPQALVSDLMRRERQWVGKLASDLTERAANEARLAAALEEADRANAAKSRFLAAASHDLRQPLQATRLFLEVLRTQLQGTPQAAVLEKTIMAHEGAEGLLDALLDLSTLDAGIVKARVEPLALEPLLRACLEESRPAAAAKGLRVRQVPCGAVVISDPTLLLRMLRNLLHNAVKYTDQGSLLLGCRRQGAQLRIEVWDTGRGIPEDKLQAIFEEFYQVDNPARDRSQGLGLGLSVVQKMSALLQHQVTVRSVEGRGSVFAITVPLAPAEALAANPAEPPAGTTPLRACAAPA